MIKELYKYDIEFSEVESKVLEWAQEALELTYGQAEDPEGKLPALPDLVQGLAPMARLLARTVARVDRVDELLSKVTQARARARRAKSQASFDAEAAYDRALRENQGRRSPNLFASADERKADATLDSIEEKRVAHHADRLVSVTEEAYDVINQCHWSLEGKRRDLRTLMSSVGFEAALDR